MRKKLNPDLHSSNQQPRHEWRGMYPPNTIKGSATLAPALPHRWADRSQGLAEDAGAELNLAGRSGILARPEVCGSLRSSP